MNFTNSIKELQSIFLHPILFTIIFFCCGMAFFKIKQWFKMRGFTYLIKGKIHNIEIQNDSLYFIIKWIIPEKFKVDYKNDETNIHIQYYHHFIKKNPLKKIKTNESDYINHYINQYVGKTFYLKAKIKDKIIRELCPLDAPGRVGIFYLCIAIYLGYLFITI